MEGYDVVTSVDDRKVGRVAGTHGEYLLVEQGTLLKSKHAVPTTFAEVDDEGRRVVLTITDDVIADSPKVDDDSFDEQAVAEYYGLAAASTAPPTEGYGESVADDPAYGAEQDAARLGAGDPVEERVRARETAAPQADRLEEEPALLGERTQDREDEPA